MQIIKPKRLGIIHKTYQIKFHHFAVGALAFFPLGEDNPEPLVEFDQWKKVMGQLPMGMALDMGFAKPRAEVLACAKGYFHQHGVFYSSHAALTLGPLKKKVRIPRKHKNNPEYIQDFLPIDIMDKRRSGYNGTYNDKWANNIHPGLPEDTNTLLFNSADKALQLQTPLKPYQFFCPGEKYTLSDLHKDKRDISGTLPNITVRIFASIDNNTKKSGLTELPTELETVWFFPEEGIGVALYRGVAEVQDSDGLDVKQLLMAYEKPDDLARSVDYYRNVLSLRTDAKTALGHVFNESQLMPEKTEKEKQRIDRLIKKEKAEKSLKIEKLRQQYQQQAMDIVNKSVPKHAPGYSDIAANIDNPDFSGEGDEGPEIPDIPREILESGDFDLTPLLDATEKLQKKLTKDVEDKQEEMLKLAESYQEKYKNDTPVVSETLEQIQQRINYPIFLVAEDLGNTKTAENPAAVAMNTVMQQLPPQAIEQLAEEQGADVEQLAEKMATAYDLVNSTQKQARLAAPMLTKRYHITPSVQKQARQQVEEILRTQQLLAGRDFSGLDLSGLDFSGLDMRDTLLEDCDLSYCLFKDCRLDGSSLVESELSYTNFQGSSLTKANLSRAKGSHVNFTNSVLDNSFLISTHFDYANFHRIKAENLIATESCFIGGDFSESTVHQAHFLNAELSQSRWSKAKVSASLLIQAQLADSCWDQSHLERCMLIDVNAKEINFNKAILEKVQFSNVGDLRGANFSYAICLTCGFRSVNMQKLYAPHAIFNECDFGETNIQCADVKNTVFKRSLLTLAQCENSEINNAIFNESLVRKVNFTDAELDNAEFFNCTLEKNIIHKNMNKKVSVKPQAKLA